MVSEETNTSGKAQRLRLIEDSAFITNILSLIHIPNHKLEDSDDDEVGDVSMEVKKSMQQNGANRVSDIGELRQRLKDKMESFKSGGKKGGKLSKKEKKEKAREERKAKAKMARMKELAAAKKEAAPSSTSEATVEPPAKKMKTKPVYNSEGKVVFSKFDFTEVNGNAIGAAAAGSGKKGPMDPKSALRKIQAQKERLQKMKDKGKEDQARNIMEEAAWEAALNKAEGAKVKDDEGLLKKTVKKIDSRKKSSKRKWDKRTDDEDKRKESSQKKRSENLQKRKKEKKDKKIKKAVKRGRAVPGFT